MYSVDEELTTSGASRGASKPRGFEGRELQRVIPVQAHLGESLMLVTLELYAEGIAVRWLLLSDPDAALPLHIELSDDRGTVYEDAGAGWFGAGAAVRGESLFRPRVSAEATSLTITTGDARTTLLL